MVACCCSEGRQQVVEALRELDMGAMMGGPQVVGALNEAAAACQTVLADAPPVSERDGEQSISDTAGTAGLNQAAKLDVLLPDSSLAGVHASAFIRHHHKGLRRITVHRFWLDLCAATNAGARVKCTVLPSLEDFLMEHMVSCTLHMW
jgi:hypothetical protein